MPMMCVPLRCLRQEDLVHIYLLLDCFNTTSPIRDQAEQAVLAVVCAWGCDIGIMIRRWSSSSTSSQSHTLHLCWCICLPTCTDSGRHPAWRPRNQKFCCICQFRTNQPPESSLYTVLQYITSLISTWHLCSFACMTVQLGASTSNGTEVLLAVQSDQVQDKGCIFSGCAILLPLMENKLCDSVF